MPRRCADGLGSVYIGVYHAGTPQPLETLLQKVDDAL